MSAGLAVVLAMVALSWSQVTTISTAVAAGGLGSIVLALAQVASLPNLALWAVSFMAGPGFRVVEGGSVDWSGSDGGLLPMVPVLAALPQPGDFPWFTVLSVLVVVGVGAFVARRPSPRSPGCPGCGPRRPWPCRPAPSPPSPWRSSTWWPVGRPGSSGSRPWAPRRVGCSSRCSSSWPSGRWSSWSATRGGCAGERRPRPDHRAAWTVVLVSGSGSNLQALIDASAEAGAPFRVLAVGADRDGTGGAERAERAGIPTFVARVPDYMTRADWDLDLERLVAEHEPDLVVSAGFMKVLGPAVLAAHRVVNTHPALLPSFPGAHGVHDAMAHGVKVTGCTCHWVDAGVDTGPIIDQRAVRVEPDDTVETLHERIKVLEREMLVDVVRGLATDRSWLGSTKG